MSETAKRDAAERRYLLGDLSEDEKTRMEEAFFSDDSNFEALELTEDELIDAYVRNELSPEEQRQFKVKLLTSPRLAERVYFARALAEKADSFLSSEPQPSIVRSPSFTLPSAEPKAPWWQRLFLPQSTWGMTLAALAVLVLLGGTVLFSGWLRLRSEWARVASQQAALQRQKEELDRLSTEQRTTTEQLNAELQREKDQRAADLKLIGELQRASKLKETQTRQPFLTTVATVFLTPGTLRSGGGRPELTLGPGTTSARIQVGLEKNDYPTYNTAIKSADGTVVFTKNALKPHNTSSGPQLFLSLPSRHLPPDDYIVHVDGVTASGQVESVSDYAFRLLNRK